MSLSAQLVPYWLSLCLWALLVATCLIAVLRADWRAIRQVPGRIHLLLGSVLFCVFLWALSVSVVEGLSIHLLGMTTLSLMLGWCFAVLAGSLALLIHLQLPGAPAADPAVAWLLTVMVPATVSSGLLHLLRRGSSRNLFVYMLGAGFGGGLLSVPALAATAMGLLAVAGQGVWIAEAANYWPVLLLASFAEGFINGMVITTFTVFYPDVVKTFDDRYYLDGK